MVFDRELVCIVFDFRSLFPFLKLQIFKYNLVAICKYVVEEIQCRAARQTTLNYSKFSSVSIILESLKWPNFGVKLSYFKKIIYNFIVLFSFLLRLLLLLIILCKTS